MAYKTGIQWTEATWNPWHGCKKVSPGCKYCYMFRGKEQYKQDPTLVQRSKTRFNDPLKWTDPRLIFPCSWSDFFIKEADVWRAEAWRIIESTPHFYQILTKRAERIEDNLPLYNQPDHWAHGLPYIPRNVLLGISAENQEELEARVPIVESFGRKGMNCKWWISAEPLIGPMPNLNDWLVDIDLGDEDHSHWTKPPAWVVVGGESGHDKGKYRYRECKIEWIESIVDQCRSYGVPVFVKQLGTHLAKKLGLKDRAGGDPGEWPEHLRVREMFDGFAEWDQKRKAVKLVSTNK